MLVIPAIDIQDGRTTRLVQGDAAQAILYAQDPIAWAERWISLGARWLHVVDLDGAFAGRPVHVDLLRRICTLGVPVQTGGGYRTPDDIESGLAAGATRVIVGTAALTEGTALGRFGERVAVSLDAREGRVAVRGWREQTEIDVLVLAAELRTEGVRRFVYTDIARDGTMSGPNVATLRALVAAAGVPIIAAGGIAAEDDLAAVCAAGVEGAIVGRALYEGRIDLASVVDRWSPQPC